MSAALEDDDEQTLECGSGRRDRPRRRHHAVDPGAARLSRSVRCYPLASARSVGRTVRFKGRDVPVQDLETFDFSQGADRPVLGRRQRFQGARGARRQGGLRRGRQHLAVPLPGRHSAGGHRGEPARDRGLPQAQHHRQPELLDDADAGGAEAAARRRADRAHQRRDLSVGVGRRPEGDRRADAADRGARAGRRRRRRR